MKTFNYNGYELKPIGNILGGWQAKVNSFTWHNKLDIENYNIEDFYKQARKEQCSCDLYEYEGVIYMPIEACLVRVDLTTVTVKRCEEYTRWYKGNTHKKEALKKAYDLLDNMLGYNNKNLTYRQYYELEEAKDILEQYIK